MDRSLISSLLLGRVLWTMLSIDLIDGVTHTSVKCTYGTEWEEAVNKKYGGELI